MLYAKVVLGLAVEGPFDYAVPPELAKRIKIGSRAWINFRNKKRVGYVVRLTRKTSIKNIKKLLSIIDDIPVLSETMLSLTQKLCEYYCCSWGEAIETAIPEALRKGSPAKIANPAFFGCGEISRGIELLHNMEAEYKWPRYAEEVKKALSSKRAAVILFPDINSVLGAEQIIKKEINAPLFILYRNQPKELEKWIAVRESGPCIVLGTRSAVFAPVDKLGLIIIDDEHDSVYKQDQVPHYHSREVAMMRVNIEKAKLIMASASPSLESVLLAKKGNIGYTLSPKIKKPPEVKIVDMKSERRDSKQKDLIFSRYLRDSILLNLNSHQKTLLFLNRKGFATYVSCSSCGVSLKCPRCNVNLVYYFKENILSCRYCNFRLKPPEICPVCNAGYVKYSGAGTEKIESELCRIFPSAKIKAVNSAQGYDIEKEDIFIATSTMIRQPRRNFSLVGVLSIDNALNRIDLRSAEKTFGLLVGAASLAQEKIIIQTRHPGHYCFQALSKNDADIFYGEELAQRRQLGLPPFRHFVFVKLRGKINERVKKAGDDLFEKFNLQNKDRGIKIISFNQGDPPKLRGNYYWQILISAKNTKKLSRFIKINLKNFPASGIIITVDVDPL